MTPNIVFLDSFTSNPGDIYFDELVELGVFTAYDRTDLAQLESRAGHADIIIVNKFPINSQTLDKMPHLKYIVVAATGYNNIDIQTVTSKGISVSNVKGYSTESVTQHVFASILAINNKVEYYNNAVKEGRWSNCPDFCFFDQPIFELSGSTLGIIGYGAIGKRVGEVALAFGMKVLVYTRNTNQTKQANLEFCDLETLFSNADVLTLHCPLTEDTKEIVNKHNLSLMKPSAILINTGRGGLINEQALFYALDHGVIAGAALDVLIQEPPYHHHPLVLHPKAIITPHIAWASQNARQTLITSVAKNIRMFMDGQILNQVC